MSSWMVVTSVDNFQRTIDLGFTKQGFKARQRKKVMEQMAPGDDLLYYVTGVQVFAATARITSDGYEDHELIWTSKPGEDYPWRVAVRPDRVLVEEDWIPTSEIAPGLEYVQKWPAEHWKLAFQGNLHRIPDEDFAAVRAALAGGRRLAIRAARAGAKGAVRATKSPTTKAAAKAAAKAGAKGAARAATSPTVRGAAKATAKAGAKAGTKGAVRAAKSPTTKAAAKAGVKAAAAAGAKAGTRAGVQAAAKVVAKRAGGR